MCLQHGLCRACSESQCSQKSLQLANWNAVCNVFRLAQLKGLPGFLGGFCSLLYSRGSLVWNGIGFTCANHSIDATYYGIVYISLLPALSFLSTFSVPSLPKKGSRPKDSRDALKVHIVHGRSSCHLRICHALLKDIVSLGDWKLSLYVEYALTS